MHAALVILLSEKDKEDRGIRNHVGASVFASNPQSILPFLISLNMIQIKLSCSRSRQDVVISIHVQFQRCFLAFSQTPTASVMLNYVSGSTHYLSGGAFREERETRKRSGDCTN